MKKFKTVEECFIALGLDPNALPNVSMLPEKHQQAIINHYKLIIVCEAHNEGWIPDWTNHNQVKYYPWFVVNKDANKPSGGGLASYDYDSWRTGTDVGSRLCLSSSELAEYVGETFLDLYDGYFLYN